jgi:hypothetical protein
LSDEISGLKEQVKSLSAEEKETKKQLQEAAAKVDDLAKITKQREESAKAIEEQTQNEWDADCDAFMAQAENKVFASNADLQEELAGFVTMISQRAINKGLKISNTDLLSQARKAVAALHDDIPVATTPAKPVTPPKKELPRTLGGMSAASNPSMVIKDEFEDLENMSPAERDAALLAMPREQMKRWASGAKHA